MKIEDLNTIIRQLARHHEYDAQDMISIYNSVIGYNRDYMEMVIQKMIEGKQ